MKLVQAIGRRPMFKVIINICIDKYKYKYMKIKDGDKGIFVA